MESSQTLILTAVYVKTAFSIYGAYIREIPHIDAYGHSINEVKEKLEHELNIWHREQGCNYFLKEETQKAMP
jgi:hypothetical protein